MNSRSVDETLYAEVVMSSSAQYKTYELELVRGRRLSYALNDGISDAIADSIRDLQNPPFNTFLVFAERYGLPINPGECVLDCGANLGACALAFGLLGHVVYAFEADQLLADHVDRNARRNGLFNVVTIPKAVSDHVGFVHFDAGGPYGHIVEDHSAGQTCREVPCTSLDAWSADGLDFKIGFLKIDVEGAEIGVLNGARGLLRRHGLPNILIEINNHTLNWFGATANDVFEIGAELGYYLFRLEVDGLRPMSHAGLEPMSNVDYLFVSRDKLHHFARHILPPMSIGELNRQIIEEINSPHHHLRASIARTLERFQAELSPEVIEAVSKLTNDPEPEVRLAARWFA